MSLARRWLPESWFADRPAGEPVAGPSDGGELVARPDDRIGTVVDNPILYHDGHYTRHLSHVIRLLLSVVGMLIGAFIGVVIWNISLYPLKEKVTEYIVWGDGQYMHVEKGRISTDTAELLLEEDIKKYVEWRETIDHTTEGRRFNWVKAHTHPDWFKPWAEFMSTANPKSPLELYRREEKSRAVYVSSLVKTSTPNEYQVEATFMDRKFGHEVGRSNWVIVLRAKRENIDGSSELGRLNPLGSIVRNYDARPRSVQEADKAAKGATK